MDSIIKLIHQILTNRTKNNTVGLYKYFLDLYRFKIEIVSFLQSYTFNI